MNEKCHTCGGSVTLESIRISETDAKEIERIFKEFEAKGMPKEKAVEKAFKQYKIKVKCLKCLN